MSDHDVPRDYEVKTVSSHAVYEYREFPWSYYALVVVAMP